MIREDRELLAELARLNGDMTSLGLRIRLFGSDEDLAANSFVRGHVTVSRAAGGPARNRIPWGRYVNASTPHAPTRSRTGV